MLRLGWFCTGDRSDRELLSSLLRARAEGRTAIEIAFVLVAPSDPEVGEEVAKLVEAHGIPVVVADRSHLRPGPSIGRCLEQFDIGVLVDPFPVTASMRRPLLSLRPALPAGPEGGEQEVIWHIIEQRADRHGLTVLLHGPEGDRPIAYCSYAIRGPRYNALWMGYDAKVRGEGLEWVMREEGEHEPLFRHVRKDGEVRRAALVITLLNMVSEGKVHIRDDGVMVDDKRLDRPLDLTREVDRAVAKGEFREA